MRITSKGQVTIPQHIRDATGFLPGTEVDFVLGNDGEVRLARLPESVPSIDSVIAAMLGSGNREFTTDEIMRMTRGEPEDDV